MRNNQIYKGEVMPKADELRALVEKSQQTDIQALLSAKEQAKRAMLDDPSSINVSAFEKSSRLLEDKMQETKNLKDIKEVLKYIEEQNRKVRKTKLYEDVNKGLLKKQPDGTFKLRDVERYLVSLPMLGTTDSVAEKASERQRRKEEQEIRRIKAVADKEEFDLAVKQGKYIAKEKVYQELAARAVTLNMQIKTAFEVNAIELVELVEGNPKKTNGLKQKLTEIFETALAEYAKEMDIEIIIENEEINEPTIVNTETRGEAE